MKRLICLLLVLTLPALALAEGTQKVFFEDETKAFPEDAELLEWLATKGNVTAYVKRLIRDDMAKIRSQKRSQAVE